MATEAKEHTLSAEKARELIAGGEATAVDIRDQEHWEEGRVPGSLHIPEDELDAREDELPDGMIVVVCEDGERSAKVAARLSDADREAASIDGGLDAWRSDKLPLEPRSDKEFEGPKGLDKPPGT